MLKPDAQRAGMPLTSDTRPIGEVLAEIRAVDADVTRYAVQLTAERCAAANWPLLPSVQDSQNWDSFALFFGISMSASVTEDPAPWVKELLLDLYEFCQLNPSGHPAYRFAKIVSHLGSARGYRQLRQFLPAGIAECYDMVGEWAEEDNRRAWEQGY